MQLKSTWYGDHPFCLAIDDGTQTLLIDLDEGQWATTYADWLRRSGWWYLVAKAEGVPVLMVHIRDGEQPYYTARHVGVAGSGGSNEVISFGIGKKQADGSMVRLWCLPNGTICGGDDVDEISISILHMMGPRRANDGTNGN